MNKKAMVFIGLFLVGCQSTDNTKTQIDSQVLPDEAVASVFVADPNLSTDERLREAFRQLEIGEPGQARAELEAYLVERPNGKVAGDLLQQIDLPANEYYPEESFDVSLAPGESLSTLAQKYLGTAYQFYALAKYNGIDKPKDLKAGQIIRVPLTDFARQARANPQPNEMENTPAKPDETIESGHSSVNSSEVLTITEDELVDDYYKQASIAFRRQELDRAIELWDKVLEIDPDHQHAVAGRLQAVELKKKLSNLK